VPIHSADSNEKNEPGLIRFELNGQLTDIQYYPQNSKQAFYFADKVILFRRQKSPKTQKINEKSGNLTFLLFTLFIYNTI
jgi:hypothetical protein